MRDRLLRRWAQLILSRPRATIVVVLLVLAVALVILPGLRVKAGHSGLVDPDDIHQVRFERFLSTFGSPNLLIVIVEGGNERLRHLAMDHLMENLPHHPVGGDGRVATTPCDPAGEKNHPGCVRDVNGRIDLDSLKSRALLYLPKKGVEQLVDALTGEGLNLGAILEIRGLKSLLETMTEEIERRSGEPPPEGEARRYAEQAMEFLSKLFREMEARIKDPRRAEVSLEEALFEASVQSGIDSRGYLSSSDGKLKIAMIRPVNDSDEPTVVVPFVDYVKRHGQAATRSLSAQCARERTRCVEVDGPLRLTLTGLPAIIADETEIVNRDVALTTVVAIGGILALFIFGFRSVRQALLGLPPLLIGLIWTLAFVRLAFDSLNLVTAAFIATLLGLGIDFAVHLLSRFNELRRRGLDAREAAEQAILGAGPGILTGALTTSGAFVALVVNEFLAFSQLGVITGVGLVFVLTTTLTLLPAMMVLPSLQRLQGKLPATHRETPRLDLPGYIVRHPTTIVLAGLAIAAVMVFRAQQIPWSYDYMKLMPANLSSVQAMDTLSKRTAFSAGVSAVVADSFEQAQKKAELLRRKPTVSRVESLASFIPTDQQDKLALLRRLEGQLADHEPGAKREEIDLAAIKEALVDLSDNLEDARFEAKRGKAKEAVLLKGPIAAVASLHKALEQLSPELGTKRLRGLQETLIDGMDQGIKILKDNVHAAPVTAASLIKELPSGMRDRLHHEGKYAIYAYPARPIWDKSFLGKLVADLRSVSPEATGFPVTHWETSQGIERGFRQAAAVAAGVLVLLLLIDFRSLRYTLLALAPLSLGVVWMWGGISLLGISYNFVNIIAFPLIIGIGVASGVHILHRYRQEGEQDVAPVVRFTGMAIFLSAATTMVGFGSLALAQHRGAASLGLVLLFGVGACLVTSTLFLPALLTLLKRMRSGRPK